MPCTLPTGRPTTLCETMGKAEIWLIRTYWDFEFPRPFLPNFEFVGGLHCQPAKPLPKVFFVLPLAGYLQNLFSSLISHVMRKLILKTDILLLVGAGGSYLAICPGLCKLRAGFTACCQKTIGESAGANMGICFRRSRCYLRAVKCKI